MNKCQEVLGRLLVPGGHTSVLLQLVPEALDQVPVVERSRSYSRCLLRFDSDGITASAPRASIESTNALLSYALSAITTLAGNPSSNSSAWLTSAA